MFKGEQVFRGSHREERQIKMFKKLVVQSSEKHSFDSRVGGKTKQNHVKSSDTIYTFKNSKMQLRIFM